MVARHFSENSRLQLLVCGGSLVYSEVLVGLGYFLGIAKCVLVPATRIQYLGMIVDSAAQAFCIPEDKKLKFAQLREQILLREATVSLKSLQRLMGKCISFSLAFPGAKFYIREMAASIARTSNGSEVKITPVLREEIFFWRFLDSWDKVVRWRSESHVAISFTSDASSFRLAAVIRLLSGTLSVGDYWGEDIRGEHINVKEMWAVLEGLQSLPEDIRDCRIDAQVDNMVAIHSWSGLGPRSRALTQISQLIFQFLVALLTCLLFPPTRIRRIGFLGGCLPQTLCFRQHLGILSSAILGALTAIILISCR